MNGCGIKRVISESVVIMRMDVPGLMFVCGVAFVSAFTGCNMTSGWSANNTGVNYHKNGYYSAAKDAFHRAAVDDPENPDYRYNLATALKKQGDLAGSEREYRNALNLAPGHQPGNHGLAQLLHEQGRTAEATEVLNQWVAINPESPQAYIESAWLQRETGDMAGAEQSLRKALQVQPRNPVALAQLGQLYQTTGRNAEAVTMYQQSLHANWRQPEVQKRLSSLQGPQYVQEQRMRMAAAIPAGNWQPYQQGTYATTYGTSPAYAGANGFAQLPMLESTPSSTQFLPPTPIPPVVEADPAHSGELQ